MQDIPFTTFKPPVKATDGAPIYLDHAATTPVREEVVQAMMPYWTRVFGNPSSIHAAGRAAKAALDDARDTIASALHCEYGEVCFTAGGTEADNMALLGVMQGAPPSRDRVIVSNAEHHAVIHTVSRLERMGVRVTYLAVDAEGRVSPDQLAQQMDDHVGLVTIMHANNEIGSINDIAKLASVAHAHGALFHTDAVQSFGLLPIHVRGLDCDLLSMSAHKLYGPKGVGALYVRAGVRLSPLLTGGAQERERRAGTENVAGIVGFGKAVELMGVERDETTRRIARLRALFIDQLLKAMPDLILNSPRLRCLPSIVNVSIPGVDGSAVLMSLDMAGICASSGSACSSGSIEPSHVLRAIGLADALALSGVRFSLGKSTTEWQLGRTVEALTQIVTRMRG